MLKTIIANFIFDLLKNALDVAFKNIVIQRTRMMYATLVRVIKAKRKIRSETMKIDET